MVIAHLPAGYILTRWLQQRLPTKIFLWAGLLGSIFPDLDIVYFYLFDDRLVSHRQYWTHLPIFWLCVTCIALTILRHPAIKKRAISGYVFLANIWLHLLLDTVMAPVYWFKPFSDIGIRFVTLHLDRKYDFWMWNYMQHPMFQCEILICIMAGLYAYISYKRKKNLFSLKLSQS